MNCIIVDDNKMARTAIRLMIAQFDFLELKHEVDNAIEAMAIIEKEAPDLVFLDVEMPEMSGLELIKSLKNKPVFILISAKKEYAIEAFELNVADYLVKPANLSRLTMAVSRAKELFDNKHRNLDPTENKDFIFAKADGMLLKICIKDIRYAKALGDYVCIYTGDKRYTIHSTLRSLEEKLPKNKFYRMHRSYLVALDQIETVEENAAYVGKQNLPIGEQFKKGLLEKLNLI
jgi:two-component system LytT family response regulator